MGTYNHKKILLDYANDKITIEIAVGHILQHLDKLYELQTTANINRYEIRGKVDALEKVVNDLRLEVTRLNNQIHKTAG